MVTHQPGWGGRGSAQLGDGGRLWVAPRASGKNAWAATARGCWTHLFETGSDGCDTNGKPCSSYAGASTATNQEE